MNLRSKRRIASKLLKCGESRIRFDAENLAKVKESITRSDIKGLIKDNIIFKEQKKGVSRSRALHILKQKRKGRRKGPGSRKGKHTARLPAKREWMNKIRAIRSLLKYLRNRKIISPKTYHNLYNKSKGGFFRSRRHVQLYLKEHNLEQNEAKQEKGNSPEKKKAR